MSSFVDFDVHGVVGVRLVDAGPAEIAAVERQLGPIQATLEREPDIVIRFVERLEIGPSPRFLGLDAVFDDEALFLLRGKHKTRLRVSIPFDDVGAACEIRAERGLVAVPLLVAIVNATALARGVLPLHASAFDYRGVGVLTTGWSKGGKTELLLGFMERGAHYIGDEWVHLADDGRRMYGLREPVRVWNWHLESLPRIRARIGRSDRLRIGSMAAVANRLGALAQGATGRGSSLSRVAARLEPLVRQQSGLDGPPAALFGSAALAAAGSPDVVLWVGSHDSPETRVEPIDAGEVAARMLHSLETEREPFLSDYRRFRFAFPDRSSETVEHATELQRELLSRMLAGKPAWSIHHPYPVSIDALCDAIEPVLESLGKSGC
jgi:hypothetical protein